jgi:hypothetical protein
MMEQVGDSMIVFRSPRKLPAVYRPSTLDIV